MGNFVGPTLSGISVDAWGFEYTTLALFVMFIFSLIVDSLDLCFQIKKSSICGPQECRITEQEVGKSENVPLIGNNCKTEDL